MHAAIDANKNGGIPLGGWTSFENDTAPNDEWLQAGTTFDPDTYPEMYLYLGGNTVPERYDHSRLGGIESIAIKTVNNGVVPPENERTIMAYDGFLFMKATGYESSHQILYINSTNVDFTVRDETGTYGNDFCVFPVKKGDVVYSTVTTRSGNTNNFYIRYYTHPLFIKATTTASSYTPSSAVQEIKDYTKDYVDAKNSYSTEETLTGGTWIDGKPIYRRTFHFNTMLSVGQYVYTVNVGQADFDTWIKTYYIGRRSNMTDIMTASFSTWTANNYTGLKIGVTSGEEMFVDYMVMEYTKKDPTP